LAANYPASLSSFTYPEKRETTSPECKSVDIPMKVVQEILGHSHISMTLGIYGHVLPGMQQEAIEGEAKWLIWGRR
jgi:integrase